MKTILFFLLFTLSLSTFAQNNQKGEPFNGLITDILAQPIKRAKIYVKSPDIYTYSDKKGRFGLTDISSDDTLKILYKKRIYFVPILNRKSLRIRLGDQLVDSAQEDQELIDYGYGYVKRREYLNSVNLLSGEQLQKEGYTTVMEALRGRVPGLNIYGTSGFGDTPSVNIRGINSINSSSTPLFLLDDVEVSSFDAVNLGDVDRIEVLKDANMYGVKGANGVIKVYTKKK
ncbi:MAG: TonB-dependent receptor plug domain-containing protein [Bacteroidaceae bacterium]|nr:TonB-dependent receptor plug domain-containing protein [Bacteroidaceae bacterium]